VWRGDYVFVGLVVGVPEVEVEFGTVGYGEVGGDGVAGVAWEVEVWDTGSWMDW